MSVVACIELVATDENQNVAINFATSENCDNLASMLTDWEDNCPVDYVNAITKEEVKIVKATYSENSLSVSEGTAKFDPVFRDPYEIKNVFTRIKDKVILAGIRQEISKKTGMTWELGNWLTDLMAISECIAFLSVAGEKNHKVYIAVSNS